MHSVTFGLIKYNLLFIDKKFKNILSNLDNSE